MSRALLYLLGLSTALAWSSNCALAGFDRNDGPIVGGRGGDGGSAGSGGTGQGGAICAHAEFPAKPMATTAGGTESFEVAIRTIDMGESNEAVGTDLDRFCSCQGEGPSCASDFEQCDLIDGRDNALRSLIQLIAPLFLPDSPSSFYTTQAETGSWSLMLVVGGYNGEADDDQVRLEWYVSPGLDNADPMAVPLWDGTDPWKISDTNFGLDANSMPDPNQPLFVDDNAYIANNVLVASLGTSQPAIEFTGNNSYFKLKITGATMSATVVPQNGTYKLTDGTIAGRIAEPDLFAAISSFRESGNFICKTTALYPTMKEAMCSARDIHAGIAGIATPCDALSFGIGFTADPAVRGAITPSNEPMPVCGPGLDPVDDNCSLGLGGAGGAGGN